LTPDTLTSKTVYGMKWSLVAQLLNVATTVVTTVVLARLLDPATWGLVSMALVILRFGQYFARMGVGSALVQKPELTDDDIRAGFTSSVLLGTAICVVVVFVAPLTHLVFTNPQVVPVARVMSLTFILDGAAITSGALLQRRLKFKVFAWLDTVSYVLGYGVVAIALALLGYGVWSLVIAGLALSATTAVLYYAATRHPLKPLFRWSVYKRLYSFGARVSVTQFLEFVTSNMDTMWAGHFFSAGNVGTYTRSFTLVGLPNDYLGTTFSRVLFPSFSRVQKETERLRNAFMPSIMVVLILGVPMMWGMAAASSQIVSTVLGSRWHAAVPVVTVLALAMPFSLVAHFAGVLCDATGHLNVKIVIRSSQIVLVLALFAALTGFGIVGVAAAYALGQVAVAVALFFVIAGILGTTRRALLGACTPGACAGVCAAMLVGAANLAGTIVGAPAIVTLLIQVVLGLMVVALWMLRARKGMAWRETRLRLLGSRSGAVQGRYSPLVRWMDTHAGGDPATVKAAGQGPS
jgi:O-antigen/teichoic acid export membrane protein